MLLLLGDGERGVNRVSDRANGKPARWGNFSLIYQLIPRILAAFAEFARLAGCRLSNLNVRAMANAPKDREARHEEDHGCDCDAYKL